MNIENLLEEILDRIYPDDLYCICCGKIIDWSRTYRLCNECMKDLKWATGRNCTKCGKVLSDSNPGELCFNCREHRHSFDRGYTCTEYGSNERAMVYALKYDDRTDISKTIGEIMSDRMHVVFSEEELQSRYQLIIPVPITRRRKLSRGYNQADLIAGDFAKRINVEYFGEILERVKETTAMKGLSPDERRRNIKGSFAVREIYANDIKGKNCLVLDDVYTTGATIDEIAEVLKEAGAETVDFLSFASGADMVKS